MRKLLALVVVLAFGSGMFSVPILAGASAGPRTVSRDEATPDGLYWCNDYRLTDNPSEDRIPQIVVDATGISHVIWFRGSSYSGQYMYKKIDRLGKELIPEKQIASGTIPEQYSGFVSPSIGIDSKSNFHIIMEPGGNGVAYAKYDSNGNNIIPQKTVPSGASGAHNPSIAVSKNDIAHVIYEDYRWGGSAEGIAYARILNDGTIDKDGVRISDPGWYCEGSTLTTDFRNNVHATFINTKQGCYHGKLDNQGNPLPEAPPTYLYKSGDFWTHGPPYLGTDGAGNVHIIWNTAGGTTGTLMYMKLNNNGVKLASGPDEMGIPLTTSPTCRGFPYIQGDSRGNAYAIWSDVRDGNAKIYYLKIEPGTENDTTLPNRAICLTKDTSGTALEPKVALDPDDNLHVVWKDNRDGNYEIYYKFAFNYGVEAGMTPEEMYKVMYVHPNETKSANMTIRNSGGLNDTVHLNLTTDLHEHKGWKVKIEAKDMDFILKSQETRKVKISVTGAPEGFLNDFIEVKVTATSEGNSKRNSTAAFRTYLVVDERMSMACGDKVHSTQAGSPTTYMVFVNNLGDIKINVNLTVFPPPPPGWDVVLERYNFANLRPKESFNFTMTVTPPTDAVADEVGVITVQGHSERNAGVKDQVVTHTVVSPSIYIKLECPDSEHAVDPGNSTSYIIFISNVGNMAGTVIIILEIISSTGDWHAELDANAVGVAGMETKQVTMTVVAPEDARAGNRLVVRVVGFNEDRTMEDSVTSTTMVNQVHEILMAVNPETQLADPGSSATYTITVQNGGNGPEELTISTSKLDVNWKIKYVLAGAEINDLFLDSAQSLSFEVVITVPSDALSGEHEAAVGVMDNSKNLWIAPLKTVVKQIYDIDLTTSLSKLQGSPGSKVFFSLISRNRGNGPDTISFSSVRLPAGWDVDFMDSNMTSADTISLNSGEIGRTTVQVTLPSGSNSTSQEILVTGTSESSLSDNVKFIVDMMLPDLYLTGVVYSPKKLESGKASTVTVTVVNQGEVPVENVTVRFYEGGTILGAERLNRLPGNTNKTVTYTWMPKAGQRQVKFMVDPDNSIIETDEKNNLMKDSLSVRSSDQILPGFEPLILLVAAAMALAAAVFRRRR
jgi:uncharacterized membrane protein